jgi:hypothetical protein
VFMAVAGAAALMLEDGSDADTTVVHVKIAACVALYRLAVFS